MKWLVVFFSLVLCESLSAQIHLKGVNQDMIHESLFQDLWDAHWISVPDEDITHYGVFYFRKTLELNDIPSQYVVHVSADNRYKLYVNGHQVLSGPARGDIYNWNFETVDLKPYLKKGKNVLAAVVWNYAEMKPLAQFSLGKAELIVQGNTAQEKDVNTDENWKCVRCKAYSPYVEGRVFGYCVVGPGEKVNMETYPWGWEQEDYDDSLWKNAKCGVSGGMKGMRDYAGRLLVPSSIPPMELKREEPFVIRKCEGLSAPADILQKRVPLTIPAYSSVKILLDNKQLSTGYFSVLLSRGKGAEITIGYAESLYECSDGNDVPVYKGNRDQIEGKCFWGYADKLLADGGKDRLYTTLWWRTYRYVQIEIHTADEPLVLKDAYATFTAYPFRRKSTFMAEGHDDLNRMLDIGWRTARLCAHETYMDCPYYEQLQYFGDTRIQTMITMYNTDDSCMVKQAIEQGRRSFVADGITASRYPSNVQQLIPPYSLCWIGMGYDYWMYRGDESYIKSLLPAYRSILSWYEQWLKPDYSLKRIPFWFFADWSAGFPNGEPVRESQGNSAFQDLRYLNALIEAIQLEEELGMPAMAQHYREIAENIRNNVRAKYWDEERKLFADTYDHHSFSQHVNVLAILAGVVKGDAAKELCVRLLSDKSLIQSTIYFRYYVQQAMDKAQVGDLLLDNLSVWADQMDLGLTTWAEQPEPSRSDCHAWGSSLNVEFYRMILGIRSGAPGFKKVIIMPSLGQLKKVSGSIPHPEGTVSVSYEVDSKLKASITLPEGITGTFMWKGREYPLRPGKQTIEAL